MPYTITSHNRFILLILLFILNHGTDILIFRFTIEPFRDYFSPLQILYTLSTNRTVVPSMFAPLRGILCCALVQVEGIS
jgi:hypothetical protein